MKYINGLAILRRISPPAKLEERLDSEGQLIAIDSGTGRDRKTILHVDDDVPREEWVSKAITGTPLRDRDPDSGMIGGCTDGWSIVDQDNNIRGYFSSAIRAEEARQRARVTIVTDVELEDEEQKAKPSKVKATEQVAVSA